MSRITTAIRGMTEIFKLNTGSTLEIQLFYLHMIILLSPHCPLLSLTRLPSTGTCPHHPHVYR